MNYPVKAIKKTSNDDAVAFSFCYTIALVVSLALFGFSIYGFQDGLQGNSTKRAQEIEDAIMAWQNTLREQFTKEMSFDLYERTTADEGEFEKGGATLLTKSSPVNMAAVMERKQPGKILKRDIDTRFHASSDFRKYGLSDYTIGFVQAVMKSEDIKDPKGDSSQVNPAVYLVFAD